MTRTAPLVRASLNARPLFSLTLAQQVKERRNLHNRNPGMLPSGRMWRVCR
jgi:hypothetical protein